MRWGQNWTAYFACLELLVIIYYCFVCGFYKMLELIWNSILEFATRLLYLLILFIYFDQRLDFRFISFYWGLRFVALVQGHNWRLAGLSRLGTRLKMQGFGLCSLSFGIWPKTFRFSPRTSLHFFWNWSWKLDL